MSLQPKQQRLLQSEMIITEVVRALGIKWLIRQEANVGPVGYLPVAWYLSSLEAVWWEEWPPCL